MSEIVVFAGLSISTDRAAQLIQAEIVGPVKRGDLFLYNHCDVFVIIDGEFGQSLSVSPKEILRVLDGGKRVIGASSMGALRASELDIFGMEGIGWIYRRFKKRSVRYDDDVAMLYSPFNQAALTVPQVNVEYWIEQLKAAGLLTQKQCKTIGKKSRQVFFKDRTCDLVLEICEEVLTRSLLEKCLSFTSGLITDVKARDAELALTIAAKSSR